MFVFIYDSDVFIGIQLSVKKEEQEEKNAKMAKKEHGTRRPRPEYHHLCTPSCYE